MGGSSGQSATEGKTGRLRPAAPHPAKARPHGGAGSLRAQGACCAAPRRAPGTVRVRALPESGSARPAPGLAGASH